MKTHPIWVFFLLGVIFGAVANFCYYTAVWRLMKTSSQIKFLAMPKDVFRVLGDYARVAPSDGWPIWPIYGFWLSLVLAMCAGVITVSLFNSKFHSIGEPTHSLYRPAVLWWILCSSLLTAVAFSYRGLRHLSERGIKLRNWNAWRSNEYIRNDFAVAVLGWLGFLTITLVLYLK